MKLTLRAYEIPPSEPIIGIVGVPERFHGKTIRTNKFNKVAEYKINIQKLVAFLYINNKQSKKKLKKTIPLIIASKKNKILRNKFNQGNERLIHCKLHNIAEKLSMTNKWKDILCSWIGRRNTEVVTPQTEPHSLSKSQPPSL